MSNIITITNEEPGVLDTDLAAALGFDRPRVIRELIDRNREELEGYGSLAVSHGKSRGRHFTAFYLNEEQALLVCLLSRTEKAKAVRAEVIKVFTAYRKGHSQQALADFANPAEAARAWALEYERRKELEQSAVTAPMD